EGDGDGQVDLRRGQRDAGAAAVEVAVDGDRFRAVADRVERGAVAYDEAGHVGLGDESSAGAVARGKEQDVLRGERAEGVEVCPDVAEVVAVHRVVGCSVEMERAQDGEPRSGCS